MAKPSGPTIPERLGGALASAAQLFFRRPAIALLLAVLLTALGVYGARRLKLDTDLVNLLPRSFPSVQAMDELERKFWGTGYVAVVAQGAEPEELKRFAEDVAPKLAELPTIRFVDIRRPVDFFREHALYYLDVDDLETIRNRFEERRLYEVKTRSPLFLGIEEADELVKPELDFSDLRDEYGGRLGGRFRLDDAGGTDGYYLDPERRIIVLLAKPAHRADDVGYANQVVEQAQAFIDGLDTTSYSPELRVALSGRYKKKIDQGKQVIADLKVASVLAFLLMVVYLGFHFRRVGAVVLVFAPLFLGVVWTFGFAGLAFGQLNLLTGFIGAVQLGLGIDHGIHLLGRYDFERGVGRGPEQALAGSFANTGRAVAIAGLTTLVAFAGLGLSEYRAFHEFGIIAAFGMVFVISAYVIVLPALVAVGARIYARRQAPAGRGPERTPPLAARLGRWSPALFWTTAVAMAIAVLHVPDNRFDYDFASLEDSDLPAFRLDKEINRILGHSQTPMVVLTDTVADEQAVVEALRSRPEAATGAETTVQFVASVADLVPTEQLRKQTILQQIDDVVSRIRPGWLEADQRERLEEIQRMTRARPFSRGDLPVEIRRQFQGPGAPPDSGFVLVFPAVSLADGLAVQALARELRAVRLPTGEQLPLAGAAMVLADVLEMTKREAPLVIGLTIGLVFVVLLVLLRRLRDVALCMGAAAATLLVTTGLLPGTSVRFNYLNIILIPVLFGIAVDGSVHLVSRLREIGSIERSYAETARAVAGSILTTALGFGAFMIAHHPGLVSLGALAVLGLAVNLLVCLLLLPSLIALPWRQLADRRRGPRWVTLLATVGLAGESPKAPGTIGTLAAVPVALLVAPLDSAWRGAIAAAAVLLSLLVVHRYLRGREASDPQEVVIDEFVGMLVAAAFVPGHPLWIAAAFVLFRLLDIVKPWPIGWVDRRLSGALSVVGDDVLAGALAGGSLLALQLGGASWGWWV